MDVLEKKTEQAEGVRKLQNVELAYIGCWGRWAVTSMWFAGSRPVFKLSAVGVLQ